MTRVRISTIINNYNYGAFVGRAVDSALAQRGVDSEVIVVDDGSTDGSRQTLSSYGNAIRLILQDNGGQAAAINAGVEASRGEILAFLDADDWWDPQKLAAVSAAFAASPKAGLVYHRLKAVHSDGTTAFAPIPRSLRAGTLGEQMLGSAGRWPFPMTSAISIRRDVWDAAGEIPATLRISADAWLVGILPFLTEVAAICEPLGFYRIHANTWYRAHDDIAMLRRRMDHWETTVRFTNAFLKARGMPGHLDLRDHFPYQAAAARLGTRAEGNGFPLLMLGLRDGCEENLARRLRNAVRAVRQARPSASAAEATARTMKRP